MKKNTSLHSNHQHLRAIGFALAAFTLWVFADTCIKLAGETSLPPYEVVAFLGFFVVLLMVVKAGAKRKIKELWPRNPLSQFARALLPIGNNIAIVIALKHLPLTLFYSAVFTGPMVTAILAAFFLHEHLTWKKGLAIIAGFIGVIIAINPLASLTSGNWIGYAATAVAVTCYSVSTVWLRVMTQSESVDSLAFITGFTQAIICGSLMLWRAEPVNMHILLILFTMAFFGVAGNLCNFTALKHTTAATVDQFHYTQIVGGAILGYFIWHDVPALHTVFGAAIIIASGLYIANHVRKAKNIAPIGLR